MQTTIEITLHHLSPADQELLIALLSEAGYEGFEEGPDQLKAYIPKPLFDAAALEAITRPRQYTYTRQAIAARNWNAEWEQQYQPVVVDDFAGVRAAFHEPLQGVRHEIVITPKMSFGTGHHATTWQMMRHMQHISFEGKTVFDFGCGTGILAILAEKLGAARVLAMDVDDWCIDNALENAAQNNCSTITVVQADAPPVDAGFDVILANINRHILLQHMQALSQILNSGGRLLLSGFYTHENDTMVQAAAPYGLQLQQQSDKEGWSCLVFTKNQTA